MLDRVLPSCRRAAGASRLVAIDAAELDRFAARLAQLLPATMRHTPHHLTGDAEAVTGYFLVLDALNFGSGFFASLRPYCGEAGYFALAASLRDWFAANGVPTPRDLQAIGPVEMARILGQDPDEAALAPLFAWCVRALDELGGFIEGLGGSYLAPVERSGYRAADIVTLLMRMPMFRDVSRLDGGEVYLLKRAQIFVHDLAIAAAEQGHFEIAGLSELTIFADNMIPFVLEANGVLRYRPELAERVARGLPLRLGSRAEVELRANAVHVCELLRLALTRSGIVATAREIDFVLWNLGEAMPPDAQHRPHISYTWFY